MTGSVGASSSSLPQASQGANWQSYSMTLEEVKGKESVTFQYNPASVTFEKSIDLKKNGVREQRVTDAEALKITLNGLWFVGPRSMTDIQRLLKWLESIEVPAAPALLSGAKGKKQNKRVEQKRLKLSIGGMEKPLPDLVVLRSVNAEYTRFDGDGNPIRAQVSLTLQEAMEPSPQGQESAAGSPGAGRTHLMAQGDNLQRIAAQTGGNPNGWRDVAAANGIDNPSRIRNGQRLALPSRPGEG